MTSAPLSKPQHAASLTATPGPGTREWEEFAADTLHNATIGIHWVDKSGIIIWANEAAAETVGCPMDEYVGHHIAEFHADQEAITDVLRRLAMEQTIINYVVHVRRKDGAIRDVLLNSSVMRRDGEFLHTRCFTRDITDWRAATEKGRLDSEASFRTLVDAMPALVVTTGPGGRTRFVNRQWTDYTGYELEDIRKWVGNPMVHPDDLEAAGIAWADARAKREGYDIDYRILRHDGVYRWHSFRIRPVHGQAGELLGWTSAAIDIEDARRLQQEISQANARLEDALEAKDEILGLTSHELRTPLTTVKGNIRLLRGHRKLSEEQREECLEEIEVNADRLERLIENMLVLARVENGELPLVEPVLLHRVIEEAVREVGRRHPKREFQLHAPAEVRPVLGNALYLGQVVANLLQNAIKYSPIDSAVEVTVAELAGEVLVEVSDRGHGVSESSLPQLFDAFFRDPRTAASTSGLGLGLAVCRRLIDAQGGRLGAAPRPGGGSTFAFTLPVCDEGAEGDGSRLTIDDVARPVTSTVGVHDS
ncbi:MAG: PAS domain-containing sensor histidine kinase [Tepidiformaceae bacterium]